MAEVTRAEMIARSARQLSVVGVGENASADDATIIGNVYDGLHERMLQMNELYWSDNNCVPMEAAGLMVGILSGTVVTEDSDFGLADDEIQKLISMQDRAERELRKIINSAPSGECVKVVNY